MQYLDYKQAGEMCPKCYKGVLIKRNGKFGKFYGCNRYPYCAFTLDTTPDLQKLASQLLKNKKPRRGKKKKRV